MLPFKRILSEEDSSLLRPQPTIKGESRIAIELRILLKRLFVFLGCFIMMFVLLGVMNSFQQTSIEIHFETDKLLRKTSDKFLSLGLDTSLIKEKWNKYSSNKLIVAARHLAPAYLRIGGTDSDRLLFSIGKITNIMKSHDYVVEATLFEETIAESIEEMMIGTNVLNYTFIYPEVERNYDNFTMTGDDWTKIYRFAKTAGFDILFDLNVLLRDGDNWDSTNAEELIKFSNDHGFDVNWQLGNEPNSFHHVFNVTINGTQLGRDFNTLRNILKKYPHYANDTLMVGPDVTRPKRFPVDSATIYLTDFLKSVDSIDAVTWHHYYLNGRATCLAEFVDPEIFNILRKQISAMKTVVNSLNVTSPMWLAETASAWGGGAPRLSDSFVDGFLWLDKLGIAAQMGLDVVIRQSLYQGYYALLDAEMNPLPDWWLSVIYKQLIGPGVIKTTTCEGPVRIYCHCTASEALMGSSGTMTVFGINMSNKPVEIDIRTRAPVKYAPHMEVLAYILTGKDGLLSKTTLLNDKELWLNLDGSLPAFKPKLVLADDIVMPPESIAFFVFYKLPIPACREEKLW